MARNNVQISVKDDQSAREWLAMVQEINEAYLAAMQNAAETLESMNEFSEGTLVDDFVNFGHDLLNAGQQVFEGIDSIADTVGDIIETVGTFIDDTKDAIKKALDNIFG